MKYFYIHYSAIGNAIMMAISMWKHIRREKYDVQNIEVHCAYPYVKQILECLPGINIDSIKVQQRSPSLNYESFEYTWEMMKGGKPEIKLKMPYYYNSKFDIKEKSICFHVREDNIRSEKSGWLSHNSYYKHEPERFVKAENYINLALKCANEGWQVIVLGDSGSTAFPENQNIINLCHMKDKTLLDDFYAVSKSKYVVASTSCHQVTGRAFNKKVLHTDIVQPYKRWWFGDINLFKKLVHKETGRVISNKEFIIRWGLDPFKIPYNPQRDPAYELIDCTYDQLENGLKELMLL